MNFYVLLIKAPRSSAVGIYHLFLCKKIQCFPKSSVVRWGNRKGDQGGADHWSCEQLASSTLFLILKTNFDMCLLNIFETWPRSTCRADRQRTSPGPWTSRSPARKVAIMVGNSLQHHTRWTETIIWSDFPNLGFWPSILHRATCNQSFPLETKNNARYSKLISVLSCERHVK